MSVKDKLNRYAYANESAEELKDKIDMVRDRLTSIGGMNTNVRASANSDKICDTIAKLVDMENEYVDKLYKLTELEVEMNRLISNLNEKERMLIHLRYVKHKKWEDICIEMNYSWRGIHKFHRRILAKLEKSA